MFALNKVACLSCLLAALILVSGTRAIINGNETSTSPRAGEKEADSNSTTFFYEADAFLLNKKQAHDQQPNEGTAKQHAGSVKPKPASIAMTSARNGRMLDLDALVGDMSASRANKERSQTGNRQSRYLSSGQMPNLDLGNGKRLHIQGFIPIMGVKDVAESDDTDEDNGTAQQKHKARAHSPQLQAANELPYAQSSIGHASFGVHRYLNAGDVGQQESVHSSMVETIKRPIKKLAGIVSGDSQQTQPAPNNYNAAQQQQQNCLCVPFYMCKNGFISESSLGRSQIQQMIQQQQQQQTKPNDLVEMKSSQAAAVPRPQQQQHYPVAPDVLIDERSFDRELVTMSSLTGFDESAANQSSAGANQTSSENQQPPQILQLADEAELPAEPSSGSGNGTEQTSGDYSQEILGRMLGLKSPLSRQTFAPAAGSQSGGACGLLRACCGIPANLLQEIANERAAAQAAKFQAPARVPAMYQPTSQGDLLQAAHRQHQMVALQKYQPAQMLAAYQQQPQPLPYGFPALPAGRAPSNQPLSSFLASEATSALAHRSSQLQQALANRYAAGPQPGAQLAQYTRASPGGGQQLQQFQQQQQQPKAMLGAGSVSLEQQVLRPALGQQQQQPLGTRKILEGRCGLRQAAGITGRVQNLQYHESSADFGEYPAQAAILKRLPGSDSLFVCGATLISQYWVATAAHCVKKHARAELKVRLGEWDVHRDDEFYPFVEKEIRDLVVHPDFVAGNLVNDIALLRLDSPVDPSLPHVNPACLPGADESFARQRCWVTGWGKDSFGQKGSFQAVLGEVELPVLGQAECEAALRQTRLGPHYRLHAGFICAGGEGGKDACEGDGGSGLYCAQDGVIKVAGLVSWGIGCGQPGVPGVYVNMAHYRAWIENIIAIDEDIYSPYANMLASGANSLISERSNSNSTNLTGETVELNSTPMPTTTTAPTN